MRLSDDFIDIGFINIEFKLCDVIAEYIFRPKMEPIDA